MSVESYGMWGFPWGLKPPVLSRVNAALKGRSSTGVFGTAGSRALPFVWTIWAGLEAVPSRFVMSDIWHLRLEAEAEVPG